MSSHQSGTPPPTPTVSFRAHPSVCLIKSAIQEKPKYLLVYSILRANTDILSTYRSVKSSALITQRIHGLPASITSVSGLFVTNNTDLTTTSPPNPPTIYSPFTSRNSPVLVHITIETALQGRGVCTNLPVNLLIRATPNFPTPVPITQRISPKERYLSQNLQILTAPSPPPPPPPQPYLPPPQLLILAMGMV